MEKENVMLKKQYEIPKMSIFEMDCRRPLLNDASDPEGMGWDEDN